MVTAGPLDHRPIEHLSYGEVVKASEHAGRIRFIALPYFLQHFNKDVREVFVPKGKRPFWRYRLGPHGEEVPVSYQPDGPWKLEPQRGPFDLKTSALLVLPKRFVHDRPLVDLIEDLYNAPPGFITPPATVSVRLGDP